MLDFVDTSYKVNCLSENKYWQRILPKLLSEFTENMKQTMPTSFITQNIGHDISCDVSDYSVQYIWYLILGWIVWCLGDRLFGPGSQCDAYKTEPSLHIQVFVWHNLMWFVTNFPAVRSSYSSRQCKLLITTCGKNSISDCSNLFHVIVGTQTLTFETI